MELHQVRYYIALCETLNFTRAAQSCNISQPALTRSIQRLEVELGGALFRRERNLTQLTELGRSMRPLLEQTLRAAEAAKDHANKFRRNEFASLHIGLPPSISARVAAVPLQELAGRLPSLEVELRLTDQDEIVELMLGGEIDAAFLVESSQLPDRLNTWTIFQEGFRIAFSSGHRFEQMASVPLIELAQETLIGRRGCLATSRVRDLCGEAGVLTRVRHLVESEEHIQQLASKSFGVVLVPEHLPVVPGLLVRPLEQFPLTRSIVLAVVSGRRYSPALDAFARLTRTRDFPATLAVAQP
jgi:DNA-binding transcriptional LysR family regulator